MENELEEGKDWDQGDQMGDATATQARDDNTVDQGGSGGSGEKGMEFDCILEVRLMALLVYWI